MAFFGGILGVLVLIGAMFGSTDDSTDTTSQGTTADITSYTLPTVAQSEASTSTSPPTTTGDVTVPELVGMRARTARKALADRGLHWTIKYKTTSQYPSGTVISQSKQAEAEVRPGSTVTLVVTKAPPVTSPPTTEPAPPPPPTQTDCHPRIPRRLPSSTAT